MLNDTTKKALDEIINVVDDKINSRFDAMLARARARAKQSGHHRNLHKTVHLHIKHSKVRLLFL